MFDKPGSIYDFGDGIHAVVRDGQVVVEAPPELKAAAKVEAGGRGREVWVPPPADAKTLPDLAIGDMWYWFVLVLGACFLFSRRKGGDA